MTIPRKHATALSLLVALLCCSLGVYLLRAPVTSTHRFASVGATYYVSTTGSDSNPGTLSQPFLTLTKARDVIRLGGQTGVTVYVRGGTYRLASSFALTSADAGSPGSPNVWANYPGETPVITTEVPVSMTVGQSGTATYDLTGVAGVSTVLFKQVYFNDEPLSMARFPKAVTPNYAASDPYAGSFLLTDASQPVCTNGTSVYYDPGALNPTPWASAPDAQVRIWTGMNYTSGTRPITAVDTSAHTITMQSPAWGNICPYNRFYVQNIDTYLTDPGEWTYHLGTKLLKVVLPKTVAAGDTLTVPGFNGPAVSVTGSHDLQLVGLTVKHVNGSGIFVSGSDSVLIKGATIHGTYGDARAQSGFGPLNGKQGGGVDTYASTNVTVRDSTIYDSGEHGMSFIVDQVTNAPGTMRANLVETGNAAINNHIYDIGKDASESAAIWIDTYGTSVLNNYVHDVPKSAVMGDLLLSTIAYNDFRRTNRDVCDTGAIYTVAQQTGWLEGRNNLIHDNYIEDTGGYCQNVVSNVYYSDYSWGHGSWGVYLDENTSYNKIYNNIVTGAGGSCFINNHGFGNEWTNNICYGPKTEHSFYLMGNSSTTPSVTPKSHFGDSYSYQDNYDYFYQVVQNMAADGYDVTKWTAKFPDLTTIPTGYVAQDMMKGVKVERNIFSNAIASNKAQVYFRKLNVSNPGQTTVNSNVYYDAGSSYNFKGGFPLTDPANENTNYTFAQWKGYGMDAASVTANPLFTDPQNGNFSLASGSPALTLGFTPIGQSAIGSRAVGCATVSAQSGTVGAASAAFRPSSGSPVSVTGTASSGTLPFSGAAAPLDPSKAYELWIKPAGYLARKVAGITTPAGSCVNVQQAFVPGDFDGDNAVLLLDVTRAISAFAGGADAAVTSVYGGAPDLLQVTDVIGSFAANAAGDP